MMTAEKLLCVHIHVNARVGTVIEFYTGNRLPDRSPHFTSVTTGKDPGTVLDGLIMTGLIDGLYLWDDGEENEYLAGIHADICKRVVGSWSSLGVVVNGDIQPWLIEQDRDTSVTSVTSGTTREE